MYRFLLAAGAVVALAGCAATRESGAEAVADRFSKAVAAQDFAAACALLAPETHAEAAADRPCAQALSGQHLPELGGRVATHVYGRQAQVRAAGDTLFLSEFAGQWRIVAAGCAQQEPEPYDCVVKGP